MTEIGARAESRLPPRARIDPRGGLSPAGPLGGALKNTERGRPVHAPQGAARTLLPHVVDPIGLKNLRLLGGNWVTATYGDLSAWSWRTEALAKYVLGWVGPVAAESAAIEAGARRLAHLIWVYEGKAERPRYVLRTALESIGMVPATGIADDPGLDAFCDLLMLVAELAPGDYSIIVAGPGR